MIASYQRNDNTPENILFQGGDEGDHFIKRNEAEFAEKAALLNKMKVGARSEHYRLVYLDEAGFYASPPVQYGWSLMKPCRKIMSDGQCWGR